MKTKDKPRALALAIGSASGAHVVKAWAVVNDDTGRLMLIGVGDCDMLGRDCNMESPAIYMTKAAAKHHSCGGERIVRVAITEI
jgi:hypothetical protein